MHVGKSFFGTINFFPTEWFGMIYFSSRGRFVNCVKFPKKSKVFKQALRATARCEPNLFMLQSTSCFYVQSFKRFSTPSGSIVCLLYTRKLFSYWIPEVLKLFAQRLSSRVCLCGCVCFWPAYYSHTELRSSVSMFALDCGLVNFQRPKVDEEEDARRTLINLFLRYCVYLSPALSLAILMD